MSPAIIPVLLFLAALLMLSYYAGRSLKQDKSQKEYFLGGRSLGGVVLAMTLVATYGSVSSFVSGPGIAWNLGLGWVVFAAPQIITGFFVLGLVGKKMAILSRKTSSLTVIDLLHERYHSRLVSLLSAFFLIVFFTAMNIAQFVGGAQIFSAITGMDYAAGLILFASVTVIYTAGGFKAVALTDTICAVMMITGMVVLGFSIIKEGGGMTSLMQTIANTKKEADGAPTLLTVTSAGALPFTLLFSAWVLVGFGTAGLPQSLVRCMAYKETSDLHKAMFYATVICGALMIGMTLIGVLARSIITDMPENGTDAVIPTLIILRMDPFLASITILAPLAATMSTVSSLLIVSTSTLMRDFYLNLNKRALRDEDIKGVRWARLITIFLGLVTIVLALYPPDIAAWINMFAFGGLEAAFFWPLILGLFWSKMNAKSALCSIIFGMGVYSLLYIFNLSFLGFHNIVWGMISGLLGAIFGVICFKKGDDLMMKKIFFPELLPEPQEER